jgi:hypothetical protein
MNNINLKDLLLGVLKTSFILIILEIFTSAILPSIGIDNFKPEFNVLIILYLAFKLETPGVSYVILFIQYVHSLFSIEGWAIGTFVGVLIYLSVGYIKDMLNFTTAISTIVVVQIFQLIWFVFASFLLAIKMGDISSFLSIYWQYIPESILLSLISPFFFSLLDRVWTTKSGMRGVSI